MPQLHKLAAIAGLSLICSTLVAQVPATAPATAPTTRPDRPRRVIYRPADPNGTPAVTMGNATRAPDGQVVIPAVAILAPKHVAITREARPVLLWYLSDPTSSKRVREVRVGIVNPQDEDDSFSASLDCSKTSGIQRFDLASAALNPKGFSLKPGVQYRWGITFVVARDNDAADAGNRSFEAVICYDKKTPPLSPAGTWDRATAYAQQGIWCDAIADLHALSIAPGGDPDAAKALADLLRDQGTDLSRLTEAPKPK